MPAYSLKQIKMSFEQKREWEKQFPLNFHIVRPLSFLFTFPIIRLTSSPSKVAWAGFFVGLAGCISFLRISIWTGWPALLLITVFSILDAVDGNIARTTGRITYYGKFIDGSIGEVIEGSYCFFLGLGLTMHILSASHSSLDFHLSVHQAVYPLLSGTAIMAGRLYGSFLELKYGYHFFEKQIDDNEVARISVYDKIQTSTFRGKWYYNVFINVNLLNNQIVCLALFLWLGKPAIFLYVLAPYYLIRLIIYFAFFVRRARIRLT